MARVRSPNYPQMSLQEAIARTAQVFAKERQHSAPKEVVLKHLGYGGINGASLGTLSALAKYGLLERSGEDYRVSDRAVTILYPPSEEAKRVALREAAAEPALFSEIFEHFGGVLPSDENLESYLIRNGFADSGAKAVIRVLRETMAIVTPEEPLYTGNTTSQEPTKTVQTQTVTPQTGAIVASSAPPAVAQPRPSVNDWNVAMTTHGIVIGATVVDQEAANTLIAILQANKLLLPARKEVPAAKAEEAPAQGESGKPVS